MMPEEPYDPAKWKKSAFNNCIQCILWYEVISNFEASVFHFSNEMFTKEENLFSQYIASAAADDIQT